MNFKALQKYKPQNIYIYCIYIARWCWYSDDADGAGAQGALQALCLPQISLLSFQMGGSSEMVGRLGVRGELWASPRTLMLEMDQTSLSSAVQERERDDASDGGSDGYGEAMHRGNMHRGNMHRVQGEWRPVKEQRVPADALDLRPFYSTESHIQTAPQDTELGFLGRLLENLTTTICFLLHLCLEMVYYLNQGFLNLFLSSEPLWAKIFTWSQD